MCEAAGHTNIVDNVAQHFHNGEIWGLNADILRHGESGQYQYLLIDQVELLYRRSLPYYIDCMTREYQDNGWRGWRERQAHSVERGGRQRHRDDN
jgi:hypothetical protein